MFKVGENNKEFQQEHLTAAGARFAWHRLTGPWHLVLPAAWRPFPNSSLLRTIRRGRRHSVSCLKYPQFCFYKYGERNGT